jgi:hypothetical protein
MWKEVLVQLARHAALRRALLVDGQVKILPPTGRQTKSNDWRLGAGKRRKIHSALQDATREPRQPLFGRTRVNRQDLGRSSDSFHPASGPSQRRLRIRGPVRPNHVSHNPAGLHRADRSESTEGPAGEMGGRGRQADLLCGTPRRIFMQLVRDGRWLSERGATSQIEMPGSPLRLPAGIGHCWARDRCNDAACRSRIKDFSRRIGER